LQVVKVKGPILLREEARRTVVSPLDDVHRHVSKHDPGSSWHDCTTAASATALTKNLLRQNLLRP
jgi:hypothetical protein